MVPCDLQKEESENSKQLLYRFDILNSVVWLTSNYQDLTAKATGPSISLQFYGASAGVVSQFSTRRVLLQDPCAGKGSECMGSTGGELEKATSRAPWLYELLSCQGTERLMKRFYQAKQCLAKTPRRREKEKGRERAETLTNHEIDPIFC
ncbi:hypothetical protein DV515_00013314 [Chloebia gouldiae]|uniref:Uncharacterized protein n=1 Tax=Chloebia gouldiae TaxID=44316 RepID=A0A3L8S1T1_CHLGU|nr:hypothetical protein DV515_00013314 [Chloebia gouldiae]